MISFHKTSSKNKIEEIKQFTKDCWIHCLNPKEEEIEEIAKQLSLDTEILQEGLDQNELPRIQVEDNATYIFTKTVNKKETSLITVYSST